MKITATIIAENLENEVIYFFKKLTMLELGISMKIGNLWEVFAMEEDYSAMHVCEICGSVIMVFFDKDWCILRGFIVQTCSCGRYPAGQLIMTDLNGPISQGS